MTAAAATNRTRPGQAALVALFAMLVAFAGVFTLPPLDRDEARFAEASAQMLETGDFITIRFQDEERNKKPAGAYWVQAASVSLFSKPEAREIWTYRLPSVLGAMLAALFTYAAGSRLYGSKTGFLAAILLASAPAVAGEATIAKTDALLLASVTAAQWMLVEILSAAGPSGFARLRRQIFLWIAIGAGVLIKGPVILLIVGVTAAGAAFNTQLRQKLKHANPLLGAVILIVMIAPWAAAINAATDGRFFAEAIGGDMLSKVGAAQESHGGPPGYYSLLLFVLFWPAAALIPAGVVEAVSERRDWRAHFLLSWIIPSFIAFELAGTKLPHYTLPLYPAFAMLAAHAALSGAAARQRLVRLGAAIYGVVALAFTSLIVAAPLQFGEEALVPFAVAAAAALTISAGLVVMLFWRGQLAAGAFAAAGVSGLLAWTLLAGIVPHLSALQVSTRINEAVKAAHLHPLKDGAPPVAIAGYSEPSAVFLLGAQTRLEDGANAARDFAAAPRAVIIEAREAQSFVSELKQSGATATPLAEIKGFNYSKGIPVDLTLYGPADGVSAR